VGVPIFLRENKRWIIDARIEAPSLESTESSVFRLRRRARPEDPLLGVVFKLSNLGVIALMIVREFLPISESSRTIFRSTPFADELVSDERRIWRSSCDSKVRFVLRMRWNGFASFSVETIVFRFKKLFAEEVDGQALGCENSFSL
jgi:hypothetical protein